jgi:hypothetical protein
MPVDVEFELARLGTAWNESVARVGVAEVLERTMATGSRSIDDMVDPPATSRLRLRAEPRSRRSGQRWMVAAACTALVVAGVVAVAQRPAGGPEPAATNPETTPSSLPAATAAPFVGVWVSTDTDGSSQSMEIARSGGDDYEVVVRDDYATACSSPGTIAGTGLLETDTKLVIAQPELTCDQGRTPTIGPPPQPELANFTLELDTATDEVVDRNGIVWKRASTLLDTGTPTHAWDALYMAGPGRYFVDPDGDDATPLRVTFKVANEGWQSWFGVVKYLPGPADGFTGLSITTVTNMVTDGCEDHTPLDPPVGPTVDDLAIALSQLAPFEVTAPPTDVTLFGYQGKHLELTVPALPVTGAGSASPSKNIAKFMDCDMGEIHSWISPINDRSSGLLGHSSPTNGEFNAYQTPGQTEEFWILDVEGTRVVLVSFDTPNAPAEDIAERDAIFDTIRIEP